MNDSPKTLLDYLVTIEMGLARLYDQFRRLFPADAEFWSTIAEDESRHAQLLHTSSGHILASPLLQQWLLTADGAKLMRTDIEIEEELENLNTISPSREQALATAIRFEQSAADTHLGMLAAIESDDAAVNVLKALGKADQGHAALMKGKVS